VVGKVLYKVPATLVGLGAGILAGALFRRLWKLLPGPEEPPKATDESSRWREVVPVVAVQGAITAIVRAAIQRGGAKGVRHLTGTWPG
jgi:hypothetical protein